MDTLYSAWNESGWLFIYAAAVIGGAAYAVIRFLDWRRNGHESS